MLSEIKKTRQEEGEPYRRWFTDEDHDLIVWYDAEGKILGFQLCYELGPNERALTWIRGKGYAHNRVDDGETGFFMHKMSPILVPALGKGPPRRYT